ncbi:MAG: M28 family peptidase [Bacteroidales bacterium]|nr:M28 family peptidase [Bacteroidales bacterium]
MKRIFFIATMALALLCNSAFAQGQRRMEMTDEEKMLDATHRNITSEKLFNYVKQLSDPALEGRLAGSAGMAKAVEIVKGYYNDFGLVPVGDKGGYVQEYPHPCVEVQSGSTMGILFPIANSKNKKDVTWVEKSYPWADGWFAGGMTGNGDVTADIVYCGFGVTAPELGYDDYKGIDVRGKIVLVEGETPNQSSDPDTLKMWYNHTLHQTKLNNAVQHGAIGLLYKWVPGPNAPYNEGFVYCHVTDMVVDDIFMGTGTTYKEAVDKIYKTKQPNSFAIGKKAHIKMNATYNPKATGKNVVGMVKGSDPKLADEYIIIAGHLDHLGMIPYHIEGANDNNSAVAVLLGAAEAFAKSAVKPKRSIVFMSLDGEEAGLTGSLWYTKNPIFPKEKVKAVINLEQVGVGEMLVANYNYLYPELGTAAQEASNKYIHRRVMARENYFRTRPRTDGAVFMQAGYPCMDFRATGGNGFYHHPDDNCSTINPEILQAEAEWLFWTATMLANK